MKTTLLWTPLPHMAVMDASGGITLRLSVLLSPRLDPEGPTTTLGAFNLGFGGNFTSWVQSIGMSFAFGTPGSEIILPATLANAGDGAIESSLWPLVFPPTTIVRGYRYDSLASARIHSYPVGSVHAHLMNFYQSLAKTSPGTFPSVGTANPLMDDLFRSLGGIRARMPEIELKYGGNPSDAEILEGLGLPLGGELGERALAFYKAQRFYRRRLIAGSPDPNRQPPEIPDPEFHEMMAIMSDYPVVLRKIGLILDYTVSTSASIIPSDSFVRAVPLASGASPILNRRPLTAYLFSGMDSKFVAKPRPGSEIFSGMLNLADDRHTVVQVDVDGSALKTLEFAANIKQLGDLWPQAAPTQEPVPSLRTGGFAIAQKDRANHLMASFPLQDALNMAIESANDQAVVQTPLYADDVTRGYRPDVLVGGTWYSLCRRMGRYALSVKGTPVHLGPIRDEGYVKGASLSGEPDIADELYAHEAVFGWDGWSLVAPRPGRTISFEKDPNDPRYQTTTVQHADNTPVTSFDLQADFSAEPGSLPRLRFGQSYRFRARAVDLAGNSLPPSMPTSESLPSTEHAYLRYEPLQQPVLLHRSLVTEGESMEHLVIRSNRGVSASTYVGLPDIAPYSYPVTCERHMAPPKSSQGMVETHGEFDALWASEDMATHQASYLLALKEAGTFQDQEVFDPDLGQWVPVSNIELVSTASTPPQRVDKWPEQRGDSLATGQYIMHTGESVALPYLPDPMVVGVTLEDPMTGQVFQRRFQGSWPKLSPFRLVVREGSEVDIEPRIELEGSTLEVYLPKAEIYKLRYSCYADPGELPILAWFHGLSGEALTRARIGTHWMLTPQREMTLVHAVQQPLTDPIAHVQVDDQRDPGQTYATLRGEVACHGKSTVKVDVEAHWVDPVDLVTDIGPSRVAQRAHVVDLSPAYGQDTLPLGLPNHRHELGDTKHHRVVYQAIGTTRFREYFPQPIWEQKNLITASETVAEDGTLPSNEPAFTKTTVSVLSTTRPDVPNVLYIVPTFTWQTTDAGKRVNRRGSGVRIYLDRPWYSSGEGELLAALVMPDSGNEASLSRFVSEWGSDPIRRNTAPQNRLGLGHFRGVKRTGKGLKLAEGPTGVVDVVGYEPEYNEQRGLWFCDIDLDTGDAYAPFLRLALARYQPDSLPDLELSRLVRADFIQLAPNRSAVVNRTSPTSVTVALSGVTGDNQDGDDEVQEAAAPSDIAAPPSPSDGFDLVAPDLTLAPGKAERHMVRARLEARLGQTDLDWKPFDVGVELKAYHKGSEPGTVVWRGTLPLPESAQGEAWRIAILEYEVFATDPDVAQQDETVSSISPNVASRIVFAAHFALPS